MEKPKKSTLNKKSILDRKLIWIAVLTFVTVSIIFIYFLPKNTQKNSPHVIIEGHAGWVIESVLSPDGSQLATIGEDRWLRVWNISDWSLEQEQDYDADWLPSLDWNPDGTAVAILTENYLIVRDISNGSEIQYDISQDHTRYLIWALPNRIINVGAHWGDNPNAQVWDWNDTGANLFAEYPVGNQIWMANEEKLAISTNDNAVQIFDIVNSDLIFVQIKRTFVNFVCEIGIRNCGIV